MKLSEAVREGAKLRPQGFCSLFVFDGVEVCSCALGAAYEATFGKALNPEMDDMNVAYEELEQKYPVLRELAEERHLADDDTVTWAVVHLNDAERLTREEIADRLEAAGL